MAQLRSLEKAVVHFYDGRPEQHVVIGAAESVRSRAILASMEGGDTADMQLFVKSWLACKRQGLIGTDVEFDVWIDTVSDVVRLFTREQIDAAVTMGTMTAAEGEAAFKIAGDEGEFLAPRS